MKAGYCIIKQNNGYTEEHNKYYTTFSQPSALSRIHLGGLDGFLYALIAFVVIDYITGLMAAIIESKLSSEIGFKTSLEKVLIFTMVAIGNIIDSKIIER